MTQKSRQKFIGVVMIASLIWAATNFQSDTKVETPTEKPRTIKPLEASKVKPAQTILTQTVIDEYSKKDWGRSPFVSTFSTTEEYVPQSLGWSLSGIIYNSTSPLAVINNRPVTVGQIVDQAEIIAIEKDEVILKIDDKQIKLKVSKG